MLNITHRSIFPSMPSIASNQVDWPEISIHPASQKFCLFDLIQNWAKWIQSRADLAEESAGAEPSKGEWLPKASSLASEWSLLEAENDKDIVI